MMSRMLASVAAFVALAIVANGTMTAEEVARVDVGSIVILEMTGELAAEYAKHTDSIKDGKIPDGLQISTSATIAQRLEDGRIRFEHTSHVVREGKTPRLVTLVATVDGSNHSTPIPTVRSHSTRRFLRCTEGPATP